MRLFPVDVGVVGIRVGEGGAAVGDEVVEHGVVAATEDVAGQRAKELLLVDFQTCHVSVGQFLGSDGIVHAGKSTLLFVMCVYVILLILQTIMFEYVQ